MINLTVLEQPFKEAIKNFFNININEIYPILPIIIILIIVLKSPSGFKYIWNTIRN